MFSRRSRKAAKLEEQPTPTSATTSQAPTTAPPSIEVPLTSSKSCPPSSSAGTGAVSSSSAGTDQKKNVHHARSLSGMVTNAMDSVIDVVSPVAGRAVESFSPHVGRAVDTVSPVKVTNEGLAQLGTNAGRALGREIREGIESFRTPCFVFLFAMLFVALLLGILAIFVN